MKNSVVFTCACSWEWLLDIPHGLIVGPLYASILDGQASLSSPRILTFEEFAEDYSDCLGDLERKILS
jgi:hypothetical protein